MIALSDEIELEEDAKMTDFVDYARSDLTVKNPVAAPPLRLMKIEFTFVDDLGSEHTYASVHEEFDQNNGGNQLN